MVSAVKKPVKKTNSKPAVKTKSIKNTAGKKVAASAKSKQAASHGVAKSAGKNAGKNTVKGAAKSSATKASTKQSIAQQSKTAQGAGSGATPKNKTVKNTATAAASKKPAQTSAKKTTAVAKKSTAAKKTLKPTPTLKPPVKSAQKSGIKKVKANRAQPVAPKLKAPAQKSPGTLRDTVAKTVKSFVRSVVEAVTKTTATTATKEPQRKNQKTKDLKTDVSKNKESKSAHVKNVKLAPTPEINNTIANSSRQTANRQAGKALTQASTAAKNQPALRKPANLRLTKSIDSSAKKPVGHKISLPKPQYISSVLKEPPVTPELTKPRPVPHVINTDGPLLSEEQILTMGESDYMNDDQLAFFKHRLQQLERDLMRNADETTEHLRETVIVPDPADRATIEEEHALELRTRERERKLLKKVREAILRIDAGDYGWCEETGEPIGVARLMARPTATLSLEAQQRREIKQKLYGD